MNKESQDSAKSASLAMRIVWLVPVILIVAFAIYVFRPPTRPVADSTSELTAAERVLARAAPLVTAGKYEVASELMRAYVRTKTDDVEVRPLLTQALMQAGEFDDAEKTIDQVLLRTQMARALWLKGKLAARSGRPEAANFFVKATQSPDVTPEILAACGLELLIGHEVKAAGDALERAREGGILDARTLGPLGEIALRQGRYAEAEQLLQEAVALVPNNPRLWVMLGEVHKRQDRRTDAIDTLRRAMDACDDKAAIQLAVGELAMWMASYPEAAEAFVAIVERQIAGTGEQLRPSAIGAGRAYLAMKNFEKARVYLSRAEELGAMKQHVELLSKQIDEAAKGRQTPGESLLNE